MIESQERRGRSRTSCRELGVSESHRGRLFFELARDRLRDGSAPPPRAAAARSAASRPASSASATGMDCPAAWAAASASDCSAARSARRCGGVGGDRGFLRFLGRCDPLVGHRIVAPGRRRRVIARTAHRTRLTRRREALRARRRGRGTAVHAASRALQRHSSGHARRGSRGPAPRRPPLREPRPRAPPRAGRVPRRPDLPPRAARPRGPRLRRSRHRAGWRGRQFGLSHVEDGELGVDRAERRRSRRLAPRRARRDLCSAASAILNAPTSPARSSARRSSSAGSASSCPAAIHARRACSRAAADSSSAAPARRAASIGLRSCSASRASDSSARDGGDRRGTIFEGADRSAGAVTALLTRSLRDDEGAVRVGGRVPIFGCQLACVGELAGVRRAQTSARDALESLIDRPGRRVERRVGGLAVGRTAMSPSAFSS